MPRATVTLRDVSVTLHVPEELAGKVTKSDLHEMALSAITSHHVGNGVQTICDGKAQWTDMGTDYAKSDPIFTDVHVEGPWEDDMEIENCDDEFETLLKDDPEICG